MSCGLVPIIFSLFNSWMPLTNVSLTHLMSLFLFLKFSKQIV